MNGTIPVWHSIAIIAVIAVVTAALRMLPFLIFGGKRQTPKIILYLGHVLPFAIMGMLVVYCLKDVSVLTYPFGLPELIAGVVVALLHLWRRNTLISIVSGTLLYMLLVQFVFV
ncbi:MAG: AzlD domain-containing protein [Clostridia bacterium]|nr:AzlD domain-containing protein [Clostridia bacterium]